MTNYLKLTLALLALPLLMTTLMQTESCRSKKVEASPPTKNEQTSKALIGVWGGKSALLNVQENGAGLDLTCAHGSIEQPIVLDSNRSFELEGTYEQESFGPTRADEDKKQAARYTGSIEGQTMKLTIKLTQTKETIGPLILTFGKMTMLQKCQ
ncbi:MAG TPA: hypothetical protein VF658_05400 [Pyrinomonadaceae bacterium]|jgi:hypothetical protein